VDASIEGNSELRINRTVNDGPLSDAFLHFGRTQMKVWLTRKYAERIDGIDLSGRHVGDVLDLPPVQADLLLAEEWAKLDRRTSSSPTVQRRRNSDRF